MLTKSTTIQFALTTVAASAISIGALLTYQNLSKRRQRRELNAEVAKRLSKLESEHILPSQLPEKEYEANETIIREQLARNYAFFGEDGMARVRGSRVVVVGCGGVGSWASVMLARSYVPYCLIIWSILASSC